MVGTVGMASALGLCFGAGVEQAYSFQLVLNFMPQGTRMTCAGWPRGTYRFRATTAHGHASVGTRHLAPLRGPVAPSTDVALIVQHRSDGRTLLTAACTAEVVRSSDFNVRAIVANELPSKYIVKMRPEPGLARKHP